MTPERMLELMRRGGEITLEEWRAGYHFCPDFDYDICGCIQHEEGRMLCQWCDFDGTAPYPGEQ